MKRIVSVLLVSLLAVAAQADTRTQGQVDAAGNIAHPTCELSLGNLLRVTEWSHEKGDKVVYDLTADATKIIQAKGYIAAGFPAKLGQLLISTPGSMTSEGRKGEYSYQIFVSEIINVQDAQTGQTSETAVRVSSGYDSISGSASKLFGSVDTKLNKEVADRLLAWLKGSLPRCIKVQ